MIKGVDNAVLDDDQCFHADFIAIAGLRRPKLNNLKTRFRFDDDRIQLRERVERIYQVALDNGHDSMLLGALGCGAFKNPVEEVVKVFKEMNEKYDGYFKQIDFAVLAEEGNPNFEVFDQQLSTTPTPQNTDATPALVDVKSKYAGAAVTVMSFPVGRLTVCVSPPMVVAAPINVC